MRTRFWPRESPRSEEALDRNVVASPIEVKIRRHSGLHRGDVRGSSCTPSLLQRTRRALNENCATQSARCDDRGEPRLPLLPLLRGASEHQRAQSYRKETLLPAGSSRAQASNWAYCRGLALQRKHWMQTSRSSRSAIHNQPAAGGARTLTGLTDAPVSLYHPNLTRWPFSTGRRTPNY
jgi:hypothetical protein